MLYNDFLVADVFDLTLKKNGEIIMVDEDLTDCGLSLKTTTKEVKAGKYNKTICLLRGDKSIEVTATTPKFNLNNLALNLGQDIITGVGEGISKVQKAKIDSTLKVTLDKTPKNPSELVIKYKGASLVVTTDYTLAGSEITFTGTTVGEGDSIEIFPFVFATSENAKKIKIDATSFPEGTELYLTTYCVDKNDGVEGVLQFKFNNAICDGAIDFGTKSERNAVDSKMTFKIIADDLDQLGEVMFIPNVWTSVPSITDLTLTALDDSISATFSPATGATSVKLQYKKSSDSTYSNASNILNNTSTSGTITGLLDATSYNVRLIYTVDGVDYYSNVATITTL